MENRKNTILLTVIAVATLLVAVVGATFAYFTAQGGGSATTQINVSTSTSSNSSFQLALETTHQTDTQTGTVSWTPSNQADGDELNFCYSVNLNVTTNTFEYIDEEVRSEAQVAGTTIDASWDNTPELVFTITKNRNPITEGITGLNYDTVDTSKTGSRPEVSGWDITEWGSTGAASVVIPGNSTNKQYHQISGTAGQPSTDNWSITATLINLDVDQQHNTNKTFAGTLVFAQVDCTDGSPIA